MKWGVRRFQNKDGSLTPAGAKRYNENRRAKASGKKPVDFSKKRYDFTEDTEASAKLAMKGINPSGGTENCVYCSLAYDIRRRGYNVVAGNEKQITPDSLIRRLYSNVGSTRFHPAVTIRKKSGRVDKAVQFGEFMMNLHQNGGKRGVVSMRYDKGPRHLISYEKVRNRYAFIDSQSGEYTYDRRLFQNCDMADTSYFRTDNLELDRSAAAKLYSGGEDDDI